MSVGNPGKAAILYSLYTVQGGRFGVRPVPRLHGQSVQRLGSVVRLARTSTIHEAADGSIHGGEFASCDPCQGRSFYWQVRRGDALVWDGESESEAREVARRDAAYSLFVETWLEDAENNPVAVEPVTL